MKVLKYFVEGKKYWRIDAQPDVLSNMLNGAGLNTEGFLTREAARNKVRAYNDWMQQDQPGASGEAIPGPAGDQVAADAASSSA